MAMSAYRVEWTAGYSTAPDNAWLEYDNWSNYQRAYRIFRFMKIRTRGTITIRLVDDQKRVLHLHEGQSQRYWSTDDTEH